MRMADKDSEDYAYNTACIALMLAGRLNKEQTYVGIEWIGYAALGMADAERISSEGLGLLKVDYDKVLDEVVEYIRESATQPISSLDLRRKTYDITIIAACRKKIAANTQP
jgi:hypothetical protein